MPLVSLGMRVVSLLFVYLVLERWLLGVARLPPASYEEPLIAAEMGKAFLVRPRFALSYALRIGVLAGLAYVLARHFRRVWIRWSELEQGAVLRLFVAVPTVVLAWAFATYDYNLYFDQAHLLDRLALVAFAALVFWRPLFVLPFALAAVAIIWQFNYPISSYSVAEQFLLVRVLLLFFGFFLVQAVGTSHRPSDFVFLVFTLLAASYFTGGLGKIRLDWFTQGNVALLLPATYANGWLGFLDPETVGTVTARILSIDWLLVAGTFVVECGAVFCFFRRRVFLFYLSVWIFFHLSVFALSGIFFWKWIIVESAVLLLLLTKGGAPTFAVFSRPHFVLSIPFIVGGIVWFGPVNLSWYNAAVSYTYRFEGVGESGRRFSLPPSFFTPYDYQFTLSGFGYLSPHRQLGVVWGAIGNRNDAEALAGARGQREVEALEEARGELFRDDTRAEQLDDFLRRFVGTFNERRSKRTLLSPLGPPPQLWTFPRSDAFAGDERIARVVVYQVMSFFHGREYIEINPRELRTIEIPSPAADSPRRGAFGRLGPGEW